MSSACIHYVTRVNRVDKEALNVNLFYDFQYPQYSNQRDWKFSSYKKKKSVRKTLPNQIWNQCKLASSISHSNPMPRSNYAISLPAMFSAQFSSSSFFCEWSGKFFSTAANLFLIIFYEPSAPLDLRSNKSLVSLFLPHLSSHCKRH